MTKKKSNKKLPSVQLSDVRQARDVLRKYLPPSPLLFNPWLSETYDCEVYLKLENMQPIGSFKIRGATYKISQLTPAERKRGVIAASAGNHAQGVAWGSRVLGVKATIVMPRGAPIVKVKNTEALGAEVILEGDNYDDAYQAALKIAKKSGQVFVHAFDDAQVIAGQGTMALELIDQLPDLDYVVGSVGGGGLMAGVVTVMKALKPEVKVVGVQASGSAAMVESIRKGKPVNLDSVSTFADGIAVARTKLLPFSILHHGLDQILATDDESIAAAILTLAERARTVSEGAGAVGVAALDQLRRKIKGKRVVVVVGGGNIDVNVLNRVIDRGLIRKGRRLRVNVMISDRPGSLARLTEVIARVGANVIQAIHDRNEPAITIDKTEVALTLETRGPEHSLEVVEAIRGQVLRLEMVN